jgi:hypothetical protein
MTIVTNQKKFSVLYDAKKQRIIQFDDFKLNLDLIKNSSIENHLNNTRDYAQSPDLYKPVIQGVYSIPPKSQWNFDENGAAYVHELLNPSSNNKPLAIERILEKYSNLLDSKDIVFEVSGGLDTSLLISMFGEYLNEFSQIGVVSERYEFRTERPIQEYYFDRCKKSIKINEYDALPFSNLKNVPLHLLPNKASLFYGRHSAVINATKKLNAKYVINGIGLDPMLCNPVSGSINTFRLNKFQWEDDWANTYLYRPQNLEYVNASIRSPIIRYLWNARKNQAEDSQKIWARNFFSEKLPPYLTKFRYKGAFDGVYETGLKINHNEIMEIYNVAFDAIKKKELNPETNKMLLNRSENLNLEEEINLMANLSYAVWIYSLVRDGVI